MVAETPAEKSSISVDTSAGSPYKHTPSTNFVEPRQEALPRESPREKILEGIGL
jgi:hypothetical protein